MINFISKSSEFIQILICKESRALYLFKRNEKKSRKGTLRSFANDRHGLSPILCDTAPLFVYTDQLLCHCILICSNVR